MSKIATPPPPGVSESCAASTAPVEVSVVDEAKRLDAAIPKRTSLPSIAEPAAWSAAPPCADSKKVISAAEAVQKMPITATIA